MLNVHCQYCRCRCRCLDLRDLNNSFSVFANFLDVISFLFYFFHFLPLWYVLPNIFLIYWFCLVQIFNHKQHNTILNLIGLMAQFSFTRSMCHVLVICHCIWSLRQPNNRIPTDNCSRPIKQKMKLFDMCQQIFTQSKMIFVLDTSWSRALVWTASHNSYGYRVQWRSDDKLRRPIYWQLSKTICNKIWIQNTNLNISEFGLGPKLSSLGYSGITWKDISILALLY